MKKSDRSRLCLWKLMWIIVLQSWIHPTFSCGFVTQWTEKERLVSNSRIGKKEANKWTRINAAVVDADEFPVLELPSGTETKTSSFLLTKEGWTPYRQSRMEGLKWRMRSKKHPKISIGAATRAIQYDFKYDELCLNVSTPDRVGSQTPKVYGVVLVHPIGVGISRWFYERLLQQLASEAELSSSQFKTPVTTHSAGIRMHILSPDLLGSGTACNPQLVPTSKYKTSPSETEEQLNFHVPPPLLNISDWSDQLLQIMNEAEQELSEDASGSSHSIDEWCIVSNGGCAPIALAVAANAMETNLSAPVAKVILSSPPRLPFFFPSMIEKSSSSVGRVDKVKKSYRTLCGTVGKAFWWYACRNQGQFIRKFSERNLVADAANLGDTWQSNCYHTAIARNGNSKFSTFCFLAGVLQDGCEASLRQLRRSNTTVHIIKGRDQRKNRARSWFWQKRRKTNSPEDLPTFADYLKENMTKSMGGEYTIGGRISLAHEDPSGYCRAMLSILNDDGTGGLNHM